ncbi:MAG TPA: copper resistance CopC family protein [Caulobacteraceae bacterium]|jgi:methionine-rich copper-binding protein CopC
MKQIPLLAAVAALAIAGAAQAHAFLDHADPKVGSVVAHAPQSLRLHFTEPVVAAACRVSVAGPPGFAGAGPARPAPGDAKSLVVELRGPAPPGRYVVHWRVISVDTHATSGDFAFTVRP